MVKSILTIILFCSMAAMLVVSVPRYIDGLDTAQAVIAGVDR